MTKKGNGFANYALYSHRGGFFDVGGLSTETLVTCNGQYCSRYIVGTRGKGEVNTGTNHLGFRCVKDKAPKEIASNAVNPTNSTHEK